MAPNNPSYFLSTPIRQEIQQKELLFHLYMFQRIQGQPNENQRIITNPQRPHYFGTMAVQDWDVRDGPSLEANIVARAQGLHLGAGMNKETWFTGLSIVFIDERFKASSLKVLGTIDQNDGGELAIIGGTGEFAFAQGIASYVPIKYDLDAAMDGNAIKEMHIRVMCRTFPEPVHATKIGPWGGNGGTEFDVPESAPQRLESVKIRSGVVIDSIAFSYLDSAGKKQTLGPWGGDGELTDTILLAPLEIVKEVSGTTGTFDGDTVVTSLTFITNVRTYGPFGKTNDGTNFSIPLMDTNVVGFFVRAGRHVNALGVYVRPSIQN